MRIREEKTIEILKIWAYWSQKLGSGYNLGRGLSKREGDNQLVKYKDTESYLQLHIPKDYEKRERCSSGNSKKEMKKIWESLYYYMRCWLIIYEKDTRHSKYETKMKQTPTHV